MRPSSEYPTGFENVLRRAAPRLRVDLPDSIAVRKRVRQRASPDHGLPLDRHREIPRDDRIRRRALDIPEPHLVVDALVGHPEV